MVECGPCRFLPAHRLDGRSFAFLWLLERLCAFPAYNCGFGESLLYGLPLGFSGALFGAEVLEVLVLAGLAVGLTAIRGEFVGGELVLWLPLPAFAAPEMRLPVDGSGLP